MQKLICVIGPTAAGKSELAVRIAKIHNGEIISADSRQIYRGLDIGTGKVEGSWRDGVYIYKDIAHHLIDEVSPKKQFSVMEFKTRAKIIIDKIHKRSRLPIICGGTMHWIDAVVYGQTFPQVKPNPDLRAELGQMTNQQLLTRLKKNDPNRAAVIDLHNPRRLIRAIEIVETTGQPVPQQTKLSPYEVSWIGINPGLEPLEQNIKKRLEARFKAGMVEEVKSHHKSRLSWERLEEFGLEYRLIAQFLQNKLTEQEMKEKLYFAIRQYAKRQLTWWKRNKEIKWFKTQKEALKDLTKAVE